MVRPAACYPLSGQVDTVGENGLSWAMVGLEGIRSAEVKSLMREVVSNAVDMVDKQKRLCEAYRKQKECMMIWMKEVTWDMVGPRVLRTVEARSMIGELVSNAVDTAEKQRRLFKAGRKQEKHLVIEVVDGEVEQLVEKLKF